MNVDELFERMQAGNTPQMLDVRTVEEREIACLEPSHFVPLHELSHRVDELLPLRNQMFVVYCHHGVRSAHAVAWLHHMGYEHAVNLEGGIDAWSIFVDPNVPRY